LNQGGTAEVRNASFHSYGVFTTCAFLEACITADPLARQVRRKRGGESERKGKGGYRRAIE